MDVQHFNVFEKATSQGYRPIEESMGSSSLSVWPEVTSEPIYDAKGKVIPGHIRIANQHGDTLGLHTDRYGLRPYETSFAALERAIMESQLDTRDLMVRTEFSHNQARCFRAYLFPHIAINVRNRDAISLQMVALDSYDGTYSTALASGGLRYICLNGCIFGTGLEQLKVKHTAGSEWRFDNAVQKIVAAAEKFAGMRTRVDRWIEVPVSSVEFRDLVSEIPQGSKRLTDDLVARYATEAEEQTLYGGWNVLTAWASHSEGTAQSRTDRDRRVAALVESKPWKLLEAA